MSTYMGKGTHFKVPSLSLTVDAESDGLADGRRDAVLGDAHVDAHVEAGDAVESQDAALHVRH